jgi:hypothetical protein
MTRIFNVADFQTITAIQLLVDPGHDPAKLVIPNGVEVHIVWALEDGKFARNILGALVPPAFAPTPAIAEQFRAALVTGATWTAYAALLGATTALSAVELRDIRSVDQPLVPSTGPSTPGTGVGETLPNEVAACVTLRTALTGQGKRGRMYLTGFDAANLAPGNVIAPASVTAIDNWVGGNVGAAFPAISVQWALKNPHRLAYTSPTTGTAHPERAAAMVPITSATMRDNHWDSQRRRGLK